MAIIEKASIGQILEGNFEGSQTLQMSIIDHQISLKGYQNFNVKNFHEDKDFLLKKICAITALFNSSIHISTDRMTAIEIYEFSKWFIDTYPNESSSDLIYCLKLAKTGHYGKIYNRMDVSVMMGYFVAYMENKYDFLDAQYLTQKGTYQESRTEADRFIKEQSTFIERKNEIISDLIRKNNDLSEKIQIDSYEKH